MFFMNIKAIIEEDEPQNKIFKKISNSKLKTYFNELFDNVHEQTSKIYLYMEEKFQKFPAIFEQNLKNMVDAINYLEKIAIPNRHVCAGIIDIITCWRCLDCTEFDSIYCSNCYIKSKHLHKGH